MNWINRSVVCVTLAACSPPPPEEAPGPPASAEHFAIECPDRGVRAFDASRTLIDGVPIDCTIRVGQRTGEALAGKAVSVLVEAGRFTRDPATSAEGKAALHLETGTPLPLDVDAGVFTWSPPNDATHTGEYLAPLWMAPYQWTENPLIPTSNFSLREPRRPDPLRLKPDGTRFENNPRDNLVTIVAWTEGEEAFVDNNANGTFDPGEIFTDLTEPFVDADDDGTRVPGEEFVDTNGNGQWDGKNGLWDAKTKIWTQQRVLWTGFPAKQDMQLTVVGVTGHRSVFGINPSMITLICPNQGPPCPMAGIASFYPLVSPADVTVVMSDPWFNRLAHEEEGNGCSFSSSPAEVVSDRLELPPSDVWPSTLYFRFRVSDARTAPTPPRLPPAMFTASLVCDLSASRGQPPERLVFDDVLRGTVE